MNCPPVLLSFIVLSAFHAILHGQLVTAHRGASYDAPENTLEAFQLAWQQGADAIEADFHVTADSQIICIHDGDTRKATGVKRIVAESTLDQLRALAADKFPTLAEVLATVPPGKQCYVELKTGPEIVPLLAKELQQLRPDPNALTFITFDTDTATACKKEFPRIKLHWLTDFEQTNGTWTPTVDQIAETVARTGADGVGMKGKRSVVNAAFIDQLSSRGITEFHIWTINLPNDARHFRDLGAFGITTDRPALIRAALHE